MAINIFASGSDLVSNNEVEPLQKKRRLDKNNPEFFKPGTTNLNTFANEGSIINVSGHNNHCGLYALCLAVSLALADAPEMSSSDIPSEVKNLVASDITPGSNKLDFYGILFRDLLVNALESDTVYRNLRKQTFINICFTGTVENDAISFAVSNKDFIIELNEQIDLLQARLFSLEPYQIKPLIFPHEIDSFYATLKSFFQLAPETLSERLGEHLSERTELSSIIQFVTLFTSAWNKVLESDAAPEKRQKVKEVISQHIYHILSNYLTKLAEVFLAELISEKSATPEHSI